ncbi:MAG: hypothetical protein KA164_20040 [Rhodoferax sp.]|nr:hypothetical protein [Rhodoferax sp.]
MTRSRHAHPALFLAAASLTLVCFTTTAWSADTTAAAQARYRQDMAVCNSGRSNQDLPTCRLEARNALTEARRGGLVDAPETYLGNAQKRCLALEGIDRSACEARMQGQGKTEGSVQGGGILRESVTVVPAN